jgi:5-methylcytosine-specific restriction endonuclease McrA
MYRILDIIDKEWNFNGDVRIISNISQKDSVVYQVKNIIHEYEMKGILFKICPVCGNKFTGINKKHCSKECAKEAKNKIVEVRCSGCGRRFQKKAGSNSKYCDRCKEARDPKLHKGYRMKIFQRDNFRCVYCGKSGIEDGAILHIDHVVPKSLDNNNSLLNLVTSCSECNMGKGTHILEKETIDRIIKRNSELSNLFSKEETKDMERFFTHYYLRFIRENK